VRGNQDSKEDGKHIIASNMIFNIIIIEFLILGAQAAGVNLWQSILNDVAQRDNVKDSHLIVLGDRGAGKRSLLQAINKHCVRSKNRLFDVEKMGSQFSGLDFGFLYVKDLSDKEPGS